MATFSNSLFKSPVFTYVRLDDRRKETELRDDKNARVVIMENDITDSIAKVDFPHNRRVKVPQLSSNIERAHFVADGRGDFTFMEQYLGEFFNANYKTKLTTASKNPIRIYENTFMFKQDEKRLKDLMDKELGSLKKDGTITKLVEKCTGSVDSFIFE